MAYLQRITLCCHQLKMCARVKAEVVSIGGETVVSGLDSATSLIQVNDLMIVSYRTGCLLWDFLCRPLRT